MTRFSFAHLLFSLALIGCASGLAIARLKSGSCQHRTVTSASRLQRNLPSPSRLQRLAPLRSAPEGDDDASPLDLSFFTQSFARLSSEGVKPLLSSFNDLVNNDKIFLLHFGLSSVFGIALLFSPNLFSFGNAIGSFACQVLSVFVLACGTFAFFAPTLEETSRALLGNTFKWTFALAATLCATEIVKSLGKGYYSFGAFFWDSAAFAVFALVSIGYFVNSKPGQPL